MTLKRVEQQIDSRTITLETGKLAKLADGAVTITCGETVVLVTGVASPSLREGIDFFPLTVDIEERVYAVGRIPGSVLRREGRPSEKATLTARLTDRPLRPSFPEWFRHDVQVIATVLQVDGENQFDVHCITAASAALLLGGVPFTGPISGARVAHIRGRWVPFPTYSEMDQATMELVVAGRISDDGGDVDVLMVEAGGFEHTWRLITEEGAPKPTEDVLVEGLDEAKKIIRQLCEAQKGLAAQCEIPEREWIRTVEFEDDVLERVTAVAKDRLSGALTVASKEARNTELDKIKQETVEQLAGEFPEREKEIKAALRSIQKKTIRKRIVDDGVRIDGRGPADIRPLSAEVGLLNRAHGTGLFERGETQAMSITTLAMPRMEQYIGVDELQEKTKRYMHHYNFPPFSTGEAYPMRGPRRREIGHGALAEKAVLPVLPSEDDFPYAIRVVSEVLQSNGSTSMASTCAACLSLMDAGVPVKDIVGGIAMGLIAQDGNYVTLTDILGAEDAYGDMDFKVTGTESFVTALQLDTKTTGIPTEVLKRALDQAKDARMKVIGVMREALSAPRPELSQFAPRIMVEVIPVDKIGELIGPKGKNINEIVEKSGAQIDIEDDGRVLIASTDQETSDRALKMVRDIVNPQPMEIGQEFDGTVVKTTDFGAFVSLLPGKDGLVHISKLGRGKRVNKVEDVVKVGDRLRVKIQEIRPDGKLSLVPADEGDERSGELEDARSGGGDQE